MNKNIRKILAGALVSISTLSFATSSFADSLAVEDEMRPSARTSHTSTLTMSSNSTATGSKRSYDAGTHKISFTIKSIDWGEVGNKVKIKLQKSSLGGYTTVSIETSPNMKSGTHIVNMGSQAKGSYRYTFDNSVKAVGSLYSNGFYANPVKMTS